MSNCEHHFTHGDIACQTCGVLATDVIQVLRETNTALYKSLHDRAWNALDRQFGPKYMKLKAGRLYWKALAKSSYHKKLSGLSIHGEGWIRQNIDRSIQWDSLANRIKEKYGAIK